MVLDPLVDGGVLSRARGATGCAACSWGSRWSLNRRGAPEVCADGDELPVPFCLQHRGQRRRAAVVDGLLA